MKTELAAILLLTLLGLVVRALTATWTGLTTDEANGAFIATSGNWSDLVHYLKEDGNPPLLHSLLKLYTGVLGHGDLSMKLFALALASLQIPLSYLILRQFLSRKPAVQVTLILALCPPLVRYSTLIRSYALISFMSLLSTWLMMKVMATRKWLPWSLFYGASTALLVYGHYWGGFVAIGQACLAAYGLVKGWFDRQAIKCWLSGVVISLVLFAPWTPILWYQLHHDMSPWDVVPLPSILLSELSSYIFVGAVYTLNPFSQVALIFSTIVFLLVVLSPRVLVSERFNGRYWKLVAVCGYLAGLLVSLKIPAIRDRYLTTFLPLFSIVFVTSFHQIFPRLGRWASAILPIAIWLPLWIPELVVLKEHPETGTPAIVAEIEHAVDRKKDLVLIAWPIISPAITFYLPDDLDVISYPELTRTRMNRWDGMINRLHKQENLNHLFVRLDRTLSAGGKIWLVDSYHKHEKRDYRDSSALQDLPYLDTEIYRMDQIRTWLEDNARQVGTNKLAPGRDFSVFLSVYEPKSNEPESDKSSQPESHKLEGKTGNVVDKSGDGKAAK